MASMASEMPSTSSQAVQANHEGLEDSKKRPRRKNVTWAVQEKLNQVRLFAAEDAPAVSGLMMQDLLEAKKTKFMHALVPVAADDLPPGFEGVAIKRARLGTAAHVMDLQIPWRLHEKFLYNLVWQVAAGDESSEVKLQRQREARVLEAVYPRASAIPFSSTEPLEAPPDLLASQVPTIPLIPLEEDEEDGMEEDAVSGALMAVSSPGKTAGGDDTLTYPPGYSPPQDADNLTLRHLSKGGSSSAAGQLSSDLTSTFLKNADPDVAAAAAAAYAVLKAKESGIQIDHDLLIKILSNPLLIETLTVSNPGLRHQLSDPSYLLREHANGDALRLRMESSVGNSGPLNSHTTVYGLSGGMVAPGNQGWAPPMPTSQDQGYPMRDQLNAMMGMFGQVKGPFIGPAVRPPYPLPYPDMPREFIHQQGIPRVIANEPRSRQNTAPIDLAHDRLTSVPGLRGQPWVGNNSLSGPIPRHNHAPQDRSSGTKIRKQCFFFNTPRGCRNGVSCHFLHETAPERPLTDGGLEEKASKGEVAESGR